MSRSPKSEWHNGQRQINEAGKCIGENTALRTKFRSGFRVQACHVAAWLEFVFGCLDVMTTQASWLAQVGSGALIGQRTCWLMTLTRKSIDCTRVGTSGNYTSLLSSKNYTFKAFSFTSHLRPLNPTLWSHYRSVVTLLWGMGFLLGWYVRCVISPTSFTGERRNVYELTTVRVFAEEQDEVSAMICLVKDKIHTNWSLAVFSSWNLQYMFTL